MHITLLYAGALAFLFLLLSIKVIQGRSGKDAVSLGDGGKPDMLRVIRGHGNFAEYVPFVLLMMAMIESSGMFMPWVLHVLGATLLVARLLHGFALSFTQKFFLGRFLGTLATLILLAVCGGMSIWIGLH